MKFKKIIFTFLAFISILFFSCTGGNEKKEINKDSLTVFIDTLKNAEKNNDTVATKNVNTKEKPEKIVKSYKYICPQGDKEGNSDKIGTCPVCEMELIENPNYKK